MFGNAFLLLLVSSVLVSAGSVSVSVGVRAKVGYSSLRVTSKASQRYKAGYFFADNLSRELFSDSVNDGSFVSIAGASSAVAALRDDLPDVLRDAEWRTQRLNMFSRLALPASGWVGDSTADPVFRRAAVNGNDRYNIVLPGGAADVAHYAVVPVGDVHLSSRESVRDHDYVRGGLEPFFRVVLHLHRRVSLGLDVGWSFSLGAKTRIEQMAYVVFPEERRRDYASFAGGAITAPVDVKAFAYEIFGHEMIKGSWLDVDVQDQQRLSLLFQGHVAPAIIVAFSCGMRYSKVSCALGGGRISYPYAHRSIDGVVGGEDRYGVEFESIKLSGGVWAPVLGLSAEYMTPLGAVSLGVEYSFFDVQLKDVVTEVDNPMQEDVSAYGVAGGWHMSRVTSLRQVLSCKLSLQHVAATVGLAHRL